LYLILKPEKRKQYNKTHKIHLAERRRLEARPGFTWDEYHNNERSAAAKPQEKINLEGKNDDDGHERLGMTPAGGKIDRFYGKIHLNPSIID